MSITVAAISSAAPSLTLVLKYVSGHTMKYQEPREVILVCRKVQQIFDAVVDLTIIEIPSGNDNMQFLETADFQRYISGYVVVYSMQNISTFNTVQTLISEIRRRSTVDILLLANKKDEAIIDNSGQVSVVIPLSTSTYMDSIAANLLLNLFLIPLICGGSMHADMMNDGKSSLAQLESLVNEIEMPTTYIQILELFQTWKDLEVNQYKEKVHSRRNKKQTRSFRHFACSHIRS
ncbi:hypothetical protein CDAR_588781 [Caerostris darwini]|uniref:Uncharacterized protein n=1 Tax=Caerostris darwini TaxID=1538125 RepID=A0AAV4UVA7_9ARAC|nr:hypothetical protein CDAR_588781 [Caerostris darwini]